MSYAIAWSPAALWALYRLHPHTAMIVDRAAIRFAERGEGELVRDEDEGPYLQLRAGRYGLEITIDERERRVSVLRVYRVR